MPLYITHASQPNSPFITAVPRFSYLAQLLPRLAGFFGSPCSSFHHEDVQLRNLAAGLLVDLYQPTLPWRLEVSDGDEWDIGDTFINGVKEVSPPSSTKDGRQVAAAWSHDEKIDVFEWSRMLISMSPCPNLGRLHSQRQREADHEHVQGAHDGTVEFRSGQ